MKRADLSPIEKAKAIIKYKGLLPENTPWKEVETSLGISETRRKQLTRLLNLPEDIQQNIADRGSRENNKLITEEHARALLLLEEKKDEQRALFEAMTRNQNPLSARQAMLEARLILAGNNSDKANFVIEYTSKDELKSKMRETLDKLERGEISRRRKNGDTKIEWTDKTWNPATGCTIVSPACHHCYAKELALRYQANGTEKYENGFEFTIHPDSLIEPLNWKEPLLIFTSSMTDIFHEDMTDEYLERIISIMTHTPRHIYQILTKRPGRMKTFFDSHDVPSNVWIGATVENKQHGKPRIDILRQIEAPVRFLSIEPLLEDLGQLNLEGIDWVIVGGESGNKARPMKKEWVLNIKRQCDTSGVPFFFKQWGTYDEDGNKVGKKKSGKLLDGQSYRAFPAALRNSLHI